MPQQLHPLPHFRSRSSIATRSTDRNLIMMNSKTKFAIGFYAGLFIVTLTMLCRTLSDYPLFPFQMDSLDWTGAWLLTTILDYYGACLCFCGVVLGTEENIVKGLLWATSFCLLGSPVCCIWMVLHV